MSENNSSVVQEAAVAGADKVISAAGGKEWHLDRNAKQNRKTLAQRRARTGYLFILPFIVGFLMFLLIPMILSLYYSFCKYDIQNAPKFIGFKNYINIFQDT